MPLDLLGQLEEWKTQFESPDIDKLHRLLAAVATCRFRDADSLIRLHECLLFLRAYPADAEEVRLIDRILSSFADRISGDLGPFESPEVSGIAGTSLSAVFSYEVARQLYSRYPRTIAIDWENYQDVEKLGPLLRRLLPLVAEDWPVEAHVPFRAWIEATRGHTGSDLGWLLDRIDQLPCAERDKADLYDALELLLVWRIGDSRMSRSRLRLHPRKIFYHREPLLRRRDVSLAQELESPPLPVAQFSKSESRRILDLILDTSAMRYRELYGFSHPDTDRVFRADAGRGVEIVFFGVPPEWRLPLRAYHAGMFFKNGVPAGYVEVLSLFERAEVGFNLYYTFREGETAWLYARLLRLFRQILGVTVFSVDPYQVGWENDEALNSGAFWFYRKLGFRPLDSEVAQLVAREERRMQHKPGHRSSRQTLEKLARSYLLFKSGEARRSDWDQFRVRNLAMLLTQRHATEPVLRWLAETGRWIGDDRSSVEAIIKAKSGPDEAEYLRLMQQHPRLRAAILKLGSRPVHAL